VKEKEEAWQFVEFENRKVEENDWQEDRATQ